MVENLAPEWALKGGQFDGVIEMCPRLPLMPW